MSLFNTDGQINLTVVTGSTYTGAQAPDGSYYIVLNDGSTYTGLKHPCGALNAVVTLNNSQAIAPNGSMYVVGQTDGIGYTPSGSAKNAVPSYLGQVATRSFIPQATFAAAQGQSRSFHRARSAITSLQLVLPNFTATTSGESAGSGGNATVTAAIETSGGTFVQAKFSGATSKLIPNGNYVVSDPITVSIAKDDFFFVRVYWVHASTIIFGGGNANLALGEAYTFGASVTDQTMGGTVVNTSGSFPMYWPAAIIAQTTNKSIGLVGDSKMLGGNDTPDATGDMGGYARAIGPTYGYIQMGIGSDTAQQFVASHPLRQALLGYCSHVICNYGTNDIGSAGRTGAQTLGDLQTISNLFPSKMFQATIEPRTTGTWTTLAGQTTTAFEAERIALNTSIRAGTGFRGSFEIADIVENGRNGGKWNCPIAGGGTLASAITIDGIHENAAGCLLMKNSNVLNFQ